MIFFLIFGIFFTTVGLLSVFSDRFDEWMEENVGPRFEPSKEKRDKNRWFNRYWGGWGLIINGIAGIILYVMYFLWEIGL